MSEIFWVAVGGAIGAVARYWMVLAVQAACPDFRPLGTMAVNVLGCLIVGAVMSWIVRSNAVGTPMHLFVVTGLLGGFTTFSAFGYETVSLLQAKQTGLAVWNVVGNLTLGLPAVYIGHGIAEWTAR